MCGLVLGVIFLVVAVLKPGRGGGLVHKFHLPAFYPRFLFAQCVRVGTATAFT